MPELVRLIYSVLYPCSATKNFKNNMYVLVEFSKKYKIKRSFDTHIFVDGVIY